MYMSSITLAYIETEQAYSEINCTVDIFGKFLARIVLNYNTSSLFKGYFILYNVTVFAYNEAGKDSSIKVKKIYIYNFFHTRLY